MRTPCTMDPSIHPPYICTYTCAIIHERKLDEACSDTRVEEQLPKGALHQLTKSMAKPSSHDRLLVSTTIMCQTLLWRRQSFRQKHHPHPLPQLPTIMIPGHHCLLPATHPGLRSRRHTPKRGRGEDWAPSTPGPDPDTPLGTCALSPRRQTGHPSACGSGTRRGW